MDGLAFVNPLQTNSPQDFTMHAPVFWPMQVPNVGPLALDRSGFDRFGFNRSGFNRSGFGRLGLVGLGLQAATNTRGLRWVRAFGLSLGMSLGLGLVWAVVLVFAPLSAHATDSPSAGTSALKALLGPSAVLQARGGAPVVVAGLTSTGRDAPLPTPQGGTASAQGTSTTVQRGETLDRVIRRTLPDVPLHPDFLRKAFVGLNPQVFPTGSVHLMRAGSTLQVPSMAALRQMMVQQNPATAALFEADPSNPAALSTASAQDKRRWVRFP